MPSATSYLQSLDSRSSFTTSPPNYGGSHRSPGNYQEALYQSPKLQLQNGSPKDRNITSQSPLARRSDEYNQAYSSSLRSSLERHTPSSLADKSRLLDEYTNRQSPSASNRKSHLDNDLLNGGVAGSLNPTSNAQSYNKSLLAEYRRAAANESVSSSSRLLQEHDRKMSQSEIAKQNYHQQTPLATETSSNFPLSTRVSKDQQLVVKNAGGSADMNQVKASPRSQLSVFNYEGGDRATSRSHLHMLTHHNLMNARQQQEEITLKKKGNAKKSRRKITVNLQGTRYDVVREVVEKLGYTVSRDDDHLAYLIWNDTYVATERISEMKSFQRINHFPGMGEICRKDCLARNMAKMTKLYPEEYNFVPKTWILPQEYNALQNYAKDLKKKKKMKIFIAKPSAGAMGNGISLYHNVEKIPSTEHIVVQEYLERPFLIDDFKCDLRIYVLVSSCDPLKIFLFNDGLVRMGTEKYKDPSPQNLDVLFMHLTNYSINKHSETYEKGESVSSGSKRSLLFLNDYLRRHDIDVSSLWANIADVIIKTMLCALPHVHHAYRMCRPGQTPNSDSVCFEILGFDIMLDRKLKPWLLEINRSPSFGTNEQIDYDIKSALLTDSLKLVNIRASDKRKNLAAQKAAAQRRLLQPRAGLNDTDDKRKSLQDKRKEELKDLLAKIRRDNAKTEYEDRNCGRFRRIFPPQDRYQQEKYAKLLLGAFNTLVTSIGGKTNGAVTREIERQYVKKYREDEVLDMLAQYEAEENSGEGRFRKPKGPPPLTGMPCSSATEANQATSDGSDSDSEYDDEEPTPQRPQQISRPPRATSSRPLSTRAKTPAQRIRSAVRSQANPAANSLDASLIHRTLSDDTDAVNKAIKEKEEELVTIVLASLQEMRIKFPGKSDSEAEEILDQLLEHWKYHKPRVASYWLVKLDSVKRRKVIDIVRSNVKAKIQHIYQTHDVEALRIYRVFSRVFNRLLWSHGQGLWNCFSGNAWETIFSKSTDVISENEMECCRRLTELCKDCLLIVYQFASDAKGKGQSEADTNRAEQTPLPSSQSHSFNKPPQSTGSAYKTAAPVNRRYVKTYITPQHYRMGS